MLPGLPPPFLCCPENANRKNHQLIVGLRARNGGDFNAGIEDFEKRHHKKGFRILDFPGAHEYQKLRFRGRRNQDTFPHTRTHPHTCDVSPIACALGKEAKEGPFGSILGFGKTSVRVNEPTNAEEERILDSWLSVESRRPESKVGSRQKNFRHLFQDITFGEIYIKGNTRLLSLERKQKSES